MSEPLVDVAGNTIEIGDWVTYPQSSGRAVQIVLGKLLAWNGKTAQIERIEGGRWTPGYSSTKYRDKATGKNISIYTADMRHWKTQSHATYVHRETGDEISQEELDRRHPLDGRGSTAYDSWGISAADRVANQARCAYRPVYHRGTLKDYVEEYTPPLKAVTIKNVANIVKVVPAAEWGDE